MVSPLLQAKGTEYFFREPYRYIWLSFFLILIYLTYSSNLATLYFIMMAVSIGIWLILRGFKRETIDYNSSSGNTPYSLILAGIFLMVFIAFSIMAMGLFQNVFATSPSFSTFLEKNAVAFLGATKLVLAESKFLGFFIFGFVIPIIETELVIRACELLLTIFGVNLTSKFSALKQFGFWVSAFLVSVGMTWYHIQAKGLTADITLMMVFFFFLLSLIIAFVPIIGSKREGETATWLHIYNNSLSVAKSLGIL